MRKTPLERAIVSRVMAVARSLGWYPIKIHGNAFQLAGLPDVLAVKDGRAAWMEAKRPGCTTSEIQKRRIKELTATGCPVAVVFSAEDARRFLEGIP